MGFLMENCVFGRYIDSDGRWEREMKKVGLNMTNTFKKGITFSRASCSFHCYVCRKERPKGTRYLVKDYEKVCHECSEKWLDESIIEAQKLISTLLNEKKKLSDNKSMWDRDMLLGSLGG